MKKLAFFTLSILHLVGCAEQSSDTKGNEADDVNTIAVLSQEEGNQRLTMHCYACHNPKTASHDAMLAPPLFGVKNRYKKFYGSRDAFITHMAAFVRNPSQDKALMHGPVKRFRLMPKVATLNSQEIEELVTFIHDYAIEKPDWFDDHHKGKGHGKQGGH